MEMEAQSDADWMQDLAVSLSYSLNTQKISVLSFESS